METLRVCILTETYYPVVGGGETQGKSLAEGLSTGGHEVILVTRRSEATFKKVEQYGPIKVYRLPPVGRAHLKKWGLLFTSFPTLFKLRQKYDLILVSGFRVIGVSAVLMSKLLNKKCILKADNNGEMSGAFFVGGLEKAGLRPDSLFFRTILGIRNSILRNADSFVAISSDISDELTENGVKPVSKIEHIPNSVDVDTFHPVTHEEKLRIRESLGLPKKENIIIYTGRLVSYKGLPNLLRVWEIVVKRHENIGLILVGSGSMDIYNCEEELKEYVQSRDVQDSVFFAGEVNNVHEYLQGADLFVFPTEREAFGISVIEAMACGLPVITTSVGGLKDIVCDMQNGLIINRGNEQALCDALDKLLDNSELSRNLGKAAWKTVQERYTNEIVTRKYEDLFNRLVVSESGY